MIVNLFFFPFISQVKCIRDFYKVVNLFFWLFRMTISSLLCFKVLLSVSESPIVFFFFHVAILQHVLLFCVDIFIILALLHSNTFFLYSFQWIMPANLLCFHFLYIILTHTCAFWYEAISTVINGLLNFERGDVALRPIEARLTVAEWSKACHVIR